MTPYSPSGCVDTLRLSESERRSLLDHLQMQEEGNPAGELRVESRLTYDVPAGTVLKLYQPGGSVCSFLVRPRNLSRTGMGFLHGAYIHKGSRVEVLLRTVKGDPAMTRGKVTWCRHVSGRVHDVGVQFDGPIVLSAFVDTCVRVDADTDHSTSLPHLRGRVLYVESNEDDSELLRFHLANIGVEAATTADAMDAMAMLDKGRFDMVLASHQLTGMTGAEFTQMLRANGMQTPIVVLTADTSDAVRGAAMAGGATEVLAKPYTFEQMVQTLSRYLPRVEPSHDTEALYSSHWANLKMRPLILAFLGRLEKNVERLGELLTDETNAAIAANLCLDLKGSSGGYGYPAIHQTAGDLHTLLTDAHADDAKAKLEELRELCESACAVRGVTS